MCKKICLIGFLGLVITLLCIESGGLFWLYRLHQHIVFQNIPGRMQLLSHCSELHLSAQEFSAYSINKKELSIQGMLYDILDANQDAQGNWHLLVWCDHPETKLVQSVQAFLDQPASAGTFIQFPIQSEAIEPPYYTNNIQKLFFHKITIEVNRHICFSNITTDIPSPPPKLM